MDKTSRLCGLYAITDTKLTPDETLIAQVEAALAGGARIIQYRDKSGDDEKRLTQAQSLLEICQQHHATFIINDDVELALRIKADGVHLGLTDTDLKEARAKLGRQAIIGGTCHGEIANAHRAIEDGADYVAFGRFFASSTKPGAPPANLDHLAPQIRQLAVPSVAIGGITLQNAPQCLAAGFAMVAVVADIFSQPDIKSHAQRYAQLFAK